MEKYLDIGVNKNGTSNRYVSLYPFEQHKGLVKNMMKCEKAHEKTNPKALVKLRRIEKKYTSLAHKLKWLLGI